jgi:precorrin-6B methylase 2
VHRLSTNADGTLALAHARIDWEGFGFEFTAPLRTLRSARTRGIENIICRLIRLGAPDGGTVVDVGANYGFVTMVAAHSVGQDGTVIAVEADATVADTLTESVRINRVASTVSVVRATVGPPGGSTTTVDELVRASGPSRVDILKIDTDGNDLGVLEGSVEVVSQDHPLVIVELAANESEIVEWLHRRYPVVIDQSGHDITGPDWPPNAIAVVRREPWLDEAW